MKFSNIFDEQEARLIQALRRRRQELGIGQEELARMMGKEGDFVSEYEQGERRLSFSETSGLFHLLGLRKQDLVEAICGDDPGEGAPFGASAGKAAKLDAAEQGQ